jgi:hypothetical protein
VISKAPIQKLERWKKKRGWNNLRVLSSFNNSYNKEYFAEDSKGEQIPALNVFQKTPKGIFHFYKTELLYAPSEKGQHGATESSTSGILASQAHVYKLMITYYNRPDLQAAFPEAANAANLVNLFGWANIHGFIDVPAILGANTGQYVTPPPFP